MTLHGKEEDSLLTSGRKVVSERKRGGFQAARTRGGKVGRGMMIFY